ncbi:response regulator receiver, partial [Pseudomonas syringae pv. japonica str. M301072]
PAAIADRGIPFMFCSGYGRLGIPDTWLDRRCVAKPFSAEQLSEALSELTSGLTTAAALARYSALLHLTSACSASASPTAAPLAV